MKITSVTFPGRGIESKVLMCGYKGGSEEEVNVFDGWPWKREVLHVHGAHKPVNLKPLAKLNLNQSSLHQI